jgi:uncharacterized protein (TIGR00266 family)
LFFIDCEQHRSIIGKIKMSIRFLGANIMDYQILGDDMQALVLQLQPNDVVRAEAGAMMYMDQSIQMETGLGAAQDAGLMGGLMSGLKRAISGESFFVTTFQAQGQPGEVAFTPPYPGKVIPLNLSELGDVLCQRDSFLCAESHIGISIAFTKRFGAGLFGGEGFVLQRLSGQGTAFIHSGGFIVEKNLQPGQTLRVDTGCIVGMTETVDYDIQLAKGIKTMLFGGEGLFYAVLRGPGKVWLQTLPFSRMADRIISASRLGTGGGEESRGLAGIGGGLLGGILSGGD